jgi:hypothetical protein
VLQHQWYAVAEGREKLREKREGKEVKEVREGERVEKRRILHVTQSRPFISRRLDVHRDIAGEGRSLPIKLTRYVRVYRTNMARNTLAIMG